MTDLPGYVKQFVRSSAYMYGDRTSFKVHIDKSRTSHMPGRHDPSDYLNQVGMAQVDGRAAVICPGNGGLVAEMIYRNADEVYAFEPRSVFSKGLEGVLSIIEKTSEYTVNVKTDWPKKGECVGEFDLIIWPEGLEISVIPHSVFSNIIKMLSPQGVLLIELCQGLNTDSNPKKVNKWMPTDLAFREFVTSIDPEIVIEKVGKGRLDRRVIYKITSDLVVIIDEGPASIADPKPTPSPVATKPLTRGKPVKRTSKKTSKNKKDALAKIAKLKRDKQKQEVAVKD